MTPLEKWRFRAMVSICHGYLDSTYKSLCLANNQEIKYNLPLVKLADEITKLYNILELNKKN